MQSRRTKKPMLPNLSLSRRSAARRTRATGRGIGFDYAADPRSPPYRRAYMGAQWRASTTVQIASRVRGASVKRLAFIAVIFSLCSLARADPAVAQFAGAQLGVAEAALEEARAALAANDYATARMLAAQAGLDARLAWGMSESASIRRAAAELNRRAERLRRQGLMSEGATKATPVMLP
jgi:hypothetical protein